MFYRLHETAPAEWAIRYSDESGMEWQTQSRLIADQSGQILVRLHAPEADLDEYEFRELMDQFSCAAWDAGLWQGPRPPVVVESPVYGLMLCDIEVADSYGEIVG